MTNSDSLDIDITIDAATEFEVEITSESDESFYDYDDIVVIKIDGKWYLDLDSFG